MKLFFQIALTVCIQALHSESAENTEVVASLYDTVTLRCSFPFIRGSEGLLVVWEKNGEERLIVHKFIDGQDHLEDQHINYMGRTELSKEFSEGTVELTLRDVTFSDEGPYYCRAANNRGHGDQKVQLSINKLNADDPQVTFTHTDGKRRLKCINIGVFRNPWVRWYDVQGKDLSELGKRSITVHEDGRRKRVESILDLDVEENTHYLCQVQEGRLKRTVRAVISDGSPVIVPESNLPE